MLKKNKEYFLDYIESFIKNEHEYTVRVGIILLLDYYIEENYLDKIFLLIDNINRDEYYIKMSLAWLISVMLIKYKNETLVYLNNCKLDDFTYNKALQKAMESNRVNNSDKLIFKSLKRKNIKKDA